MRKHIQIYIDTRRPEWIVRQEDPESISGYSELTTKRVSIEVKSETQIIERNSKWCWCVACHGVMVIEGDVVRIV